MARTGYVTLVDRLRGGVIPAVPVPFDRSGLIDRELQAQYVSWMAQQRIAGVAVWAHTGRGLHLSAEQLALVLRSWKDGVGDIPIVCGVGVPEWASLPPDAHGRVDAGIQITVEMAAQAARLGAAAVMVHPPGELLATPDWGERVIELHAAVCEVGIPVIAFYLYEAAGGLPYTREHVELLLAMDEVIGIKIATLDSVMTFQDLAATVAHSPESILITGEDRFLGYSLAMGAECALVGLAAACTDKCVELVDAWRASRHGDYLRASRSIDDFAASTFTHPMEGYVQRVLWLLEADSVFDGRAYDPYGPAMPESERDRVFAALRTLRSE